MPDWLPFASWLGGAIRLGRRHLLRRDLLIELPPPALLQEAPHDDEARRAGVVHKGDVHGGGGRRPQDLVYREGVDGGALNLVGLLARDPAGLVVLAPEGGAEVGVGLLEVPCPYGLVVALDGHCDRLLLAWGLDGRGLLAAAHAGSLPFASVGSVGRPDAGGEVDVGIRVQRGPRRGVLLHDHARGHRFTGGLFPPAEEKTRFFQGVLRLRVAETDHLRDSCDLWRLTDHEEDLRVLLRLIPTRHRLLEHPAGVFLGAFPGSDLYFED